MYHGYRAAPKTAAGMQDIELPALAKHAATDRGMQIMGAGMFALSFFARSA